MSSDFPTIVNNNYPLYSENEIPKCLENRISCVKEGKNPYYFSSLWSFSSYFITHHLNPILKTFIRENNYSKELFFRTVF